MPLKRYLARRKSKQILKSFLGAVLNFPAPIEDLTLEDPLQYP